MRIGVNEPAALSPSVVSNMVTNIPNTESGVSLRGIIWNQVKQ